MFGVAIVQVPLPDRALHPFSKPHSLLHLPRSLSPWAEKKEVIGAHIVAKRSATYEGIVEDESLLHPQLNTALGVVASISGTVASSGASVYFEKIVKQSETQASLWIRNVQLAFYSLFPSLFLGVMFFDGEKISKHGFFVGYNWAVWLSIVLQATGGVLVSLAVKYADNITKSFAISFSILLSLIASVWFFDFVVTKHVSSISLLRLERAKSPRSSLWVPRQYFLRRICIIPDNRLHLGPNHCRFTILKKQPSRSTKLGKVQPFLNYLTPL